MAGIALATDRTGLVKILNVGTPPGQKDVFQALDSWIPRGVSGFDEKTVLHFDPELAKKRLAEAGFPGGQGLPKIDLAIDSRDEHRQIAERLQAQWASILGIKIYIVTRDPVAHLGSLRVNAPQIFRFGIGAVFLDPDLFARVFIDDGGLNFAHRKNPA